MAPSERDGPSDQTILREVATVLRKSDDPNQLTFKQVRLAVEKSLGLPEGSLHKSSKATIKQAVHNVMDELDREAAAKEREATAEEKEEKEEDEKEPQEEEEAVDDDDGEEMEEQEGEFEGVRPVIENSAAGAAGAAGAAAPPGRTDGESPAAQRAKKRGKVAVVAQSAGDGADAPAAKRGKKTKKKQEKSGGGTKKDNNSMVCVLNKTTRTRKQVNVEKFQGRLLVSVREYYRDGEEFLPAKKGIALNREQWEALRSATKRIDRAVDKLS